MKKITTLLFFAAIVQSQAQKLSKEIKGDRLYEAYAYADAAETYRRAETLTVDGYRNLAVAYANIGNYAGAEAAYKKFVNESTNPEDYFNYAMVLKYNQKYEEAEKWLDRFSSTKPLDLRSKDFIANRSKMQALLVNSGQYKINPLSINTDEDDFGPAYYKDKIVFASSRTNSPMVDRTYNWTEKPFLDLYMADASNGQLTNAKILNKRINQKWHEGPAAFSNGGTIMAFTRNNYESKSAEGVVKLQLFFAELKDGEWINTQAFKLNSAEYSVGHPWLTEDGKTMYFASDMPGGFGGSDLYRITRNFNGEWGTPENLGNTVNTEGNELFPFYESKSNVLFFASNGRMGLGGLDVFAAPLGSKGSFGNAMNMGAGVNSAQDDFGFILDANQKGYLSSNRSGGAGGDDLYAVDVLKPISFGKQVNGLVKNNSGNPVADATVVVNDNAGQTINTFQTDAQGKFSFTGEYDKTFSLKASAEKYLDANTTVNTGVADATVNTELTLGDPPPPPVVIEVGVDLAKIAPNMKPIYFDLGKSDIRSDAAIELDKIVVLMNENPTMVVELGSHTDCRGKATSNQKLSEARAKASAKYIKERITNPDRINGKGYGESKLINNCACEGANSDCTEEEHQVNRRTEFIVVKM